MSVTIKDYQDWLKNNKQAKVAKKGETLSSFDEQENRALQRLLVRRARLPDGQEQIFSIVVDRFIKRKKGGKKAKK